MLSWVKLRPVVLLLAMPLLLSCKKDDPAPTQDGMQITFMQFSMSSSTTSDPVILSFQDPDGLGGNDPIIEGGTLDADALYFGNLQMIDEISNPPRNINLDIEAAPDNFQIFFQVIDLNLDLIYADQDANGFPIGLFNAINTGASSTGSILISVVQSPNKSAVGVSEGQISNAGGQTLLSALFPIMIK